MERTSEIVFVPHANDVKKLIGGEQFMILT